ncbi:MAG: hypothetical protein H6746_18385 [Deltaproteobacteria bacterium]|nr:hypothetical protein [Deltaproteobacteria bacterium]
MALLPGLAAAGTARAADAPPGPGWVLEPSAERAVRAALRTDEALSGQPLNATIARDRVLVRLGSEEAPTLLVTLVRADDAPEGAPRAAGVALLAEPGPAPEAEVAALMERLAAAPQPIPWAPAPVDAPPPPPQPATPADDAATEAVREELSAARHAMRIGDVAEAERRLRALPEDAARVARMDIALLWRQLGDVAAARSALAAVEDPGPAEQATAALIREGADTPGDPVALATAETACRFTGVVDTLHELGRPDRAAEAARRLRTLDPDCRFAWELEIQALVAARAPDQAVALAEQALERFPDDADMAAAAAAAFQSGDELAKAVPLLERSGRARLGKPGALRPLLGAMVRDVPNRDAYRAELQRRVATAPDDDVARFLLAVIRHYENDFAGSQALLEQVEDALDVEDRLHVYMAMNDFNMGNRDAALARLRRVAQRADPDPDIYYCLAEIERDTDRVAARDNLDRYAAMSQGDPLSNPGKEARIRRLQALLRECIADGRAECEGEWEHPRLRHQDANEGWVWGVGVAGGVVVLALLGWAWRGRRRSASGG